MISGDELFALADTHGFPAELTVEIVREQGLEVDLKRYEALMEAQRERARAAHKFGLPEKELTGLQDEIPMRRISTFTGYKSLEEKTAIKALLVDNKSVGLIEEGQEARLILEATPFYGEMGG
ncbi:MAG: alanine--tRNA ligase-related protein, partial [Planctomycetota bacterium]|nr:alanine--tRNA ligase-related protein [Planctomycetota bacterium]